jgi:flavin-dependent dehydrogenase
MDRRVVLSEVKKRRIFSPSGRTLDIPLEGKGVWHIDRGLFDMQLAIQAVNAGAQVLINTKVTSLLTQEETIIGVTTSSKAMPEIHGKVVIAADGIRSIMQGIPKWSGLVGTDVEVWSTINWWLANVKDVEPGVLEHHLGPYGSKRGWIWLERCDSSVCQADFPSFEAFNECRRGDSVLSKKIRDAVPVRITGCAHPLNLGQPLPKKVKSGLILAGAAAGYMHILRCVLSGRYAGETAIEAIKEGNVTKDRLAAYEILCEKLRDTRKLGFAAFWEQSVNQPEELLDRFSSMGNLDFDILDL